MKATLSSPFAASAQRGLTLVELMIAIMIAAVLMIGSFFGYRLIHTAHAQNDIRLLNQAGNCVTQSYVTLPNFNGISAATVADTACFPKSNVRINANTSTLTTASGQTITVAAVEGPDHAADGAVAFTITAPIKKETCIQTAMGLLNSASRLVVGNKVVKEFSDTLTVSNINPGCAEADNSIQYIVAK